MSMTASAFVSTAHSQRDLTQLCKHWAHNLDVEFDETNGRVIFPKDARGANWPGDATVRFVARESGLDVMIEATSDGQLNGLKGAVARHLDRFAHREAPLAFDWS